MQRFNPHPALRAAQPHRGEGKSIELTMTKREIKPPFQFDGEGGLGDWDYRVPTSNQFSNPRNPRKKAVRSYIHVHQCSSVAAFAIGGSLRLCENPENGRRRAMPMLPHRRYRGCPMSSIYDKVFRAAEICIPPDSLPVNFTGGRLGP